MRLLPPLIVSEAEIAEAVQRIERACERLAKKHERPLQAGSRRMSANGVRHFLDLIDIPQDDLRGMIDGEPRHEGQAQERRPPATARSPARRWP